MVGAAAEIRYSPSILTSFVFVLRFSHCISNATL